MPTVDSATPQREPAIPPPVGTASVQSSPPGTRLIHRTRPSILIVFDTRFEESRAVLKGIVAYERSHGPWSFFLDDYQKSEADPTWVAGRHWNGVISRHTSPSLAQRCAEHGLPLVDLNDGPPIPGVPKIRPDNIAVGHQGAEHLIERGFTSLAFCSQASDLWASERRDGFSEAAKLAGHTVFVHELQDNGNTHPSWDETRVSGLVQWLRSLPKPVGVMACNDLHAQNIISAAHQAGLLVPEEVAVLGANNDITRCEMVYPYLSSVAMNHFRSGYLAAETLDQLMMGVKPDSFDVRIDPLEVVTRQSTDLFAIRDRCIASALAFIRERACSGVTVEQVLQHASASRSLLEKKFREHLGMSPHAVIRKMRVTKIKQLLYETDYPLKKIAELTGFEHVEYMCVLFKRATGISPGEYRKRQQAKVPKQ